MPLKFLHNNDNALTESSWIKLKMVLTETPKALSFDIFGTVLVSSHD